MSTRHRKVAEQTGYSDGPNLELYRPRTEKEVRGDFSNQNIGFVSFRLNFQKEDGVSLEVRDAWEPYFQKNGANTFYFSGETDLEHMQSGRGVEYMSAHFQDAPHPDQSEKRSIQDLQRKLREPGEISSQDLDYLTGKSDNPQSVTEEAKLIVSAKKYLKKKLGDWIDEKKIDTLILENTQSLPANFALSLALVEVAKEKNVSVVNHMHDFHFEREWFKTKKGSYLEGLFNHLINGFESQTPVVINSTQKQELANRGVFQESEIQVAGNLRIFDRPHDWSQDELGQIKKLKKTIQGGDDDAIILGSMVRPVKRKYLRMGVRIAAEVSHQSGKKIKFYIPHPMIRPDEDPSYPKRIKAFGAEISQQESVDVDVVFANENDPSFAVPLKVHYGAIEHNLYTPKQEGWGNGYLEGLLYGIDQTVNQYEIFQKDISGKGEDIIRVNHRKDDGNSERIREQKEIEEAAKKIVEWLGQPIDQKTQRRLHNWNVGRENFDISQLDKLQLPGRGKNII